MYCRQCGNHIDATDKFCAQCGAPVTNPPNSSAGIYNKAPVPAKQPRRRGFIENFIYVLQNCLNFSGRASRREYWLFFLAFLLFWFLVCYILGIFTRLRHYQIDALSFIAGLFCHLALVVRRLHDVEKSGWWYLLVFIPLINLYLVYLTWFKKGDTGNNKYGGDPLA